MSALPQNKREKNRLQTIPLDCCVTNRVGENGLDSQQSCALWCYWTCIRQSTTAHSCICISRISLTQQQLNSAFHPSRAGKWVVIHVISAKVCERGLLLQLRRYAGSVCDVQWCCSCSTRFVPLHKPVHDNYNLKSHKYVCITNYQPDTKSNPNPNPTTKQHTIVNIQLNSHMSYISR